MYGNRMTPPAAPGMPPSQMSSTHLPPHSQMPFGSPYPSPAVAPSPYGQGQHVTGNIITLIFFHMRLTWVNWVTVILGICSFLSAN